MEGREHPSNNQNQEGGKMTSEDNAVLPHACPDMERNIREGEVAIKYSPSFREYSILYPESPGSVQLIQYCPWCGTKLPDSLREEWGEALDRLGIYNPYFDDRDKVPRHYWTDEWWRADSQKL